MLVAYEGGLLYFGPQVMRNGADVWLRRLLESLGFGQYFLLPFMTCSLLLAWHHVSRQSWRLRGHVLYGMLIESLAFGAVLLAFAHLHRAVLAIDPPTAIEPTRAVRSAISYLGAGIYEELVFRLVFVSALVSGIRTAGITRTNSLIASIVVSSVLFAGAHYQWELWSFTAYGETFDWSTFTFRFSAGILFALLFVFRGFGIAVGAHAIYDILVGC